MDRATQFVEDLRKAYEEYDESDDTDHGHERADKVLCELLRELGFDDGIDLYEEQHRDFE